MTTETSCRRIKTKDARRPAPRFLRDQIIGVTDFQNFPFTCFTATYNQFFESRVRFRPFACYRVAAMEFSSTANSLASAARVTANRANSQLSTGPKTPEGKAKSSLNAVKSALTGRTVLLSSDDAALYERHVARFASQFNPVGERETELVQSLADTQWRLNRIPSLEMGIYALARLNFKNMFQEEQPDVREALIQAHTFITQQKQLNNLSIQESRLRRYYQKDLAELRQLQQARLKKPVGATHASPEPAKSEIGFVFSSGTPDTTEPRVSASGENSSSPDKDQISARAA